MEEVRFGMADAWGAYVHTGEKRAGLPGKLGVNERRDLVAVCGGESVRASRTATPAKKCRGESHIPRATNRSV